MSPCSWKLFNGNILDVIRGRDPDITRLSTDLEFPEDEVDAAGCVSPEIRAAASQSASSDLDLGEEDVAAAEDIRLDEGDRKAT